MGEPGFVCEVPVYSTEDLTMFCDLEDELRERLEKEFGFSSEAAEGASKEAVSAIMSRGRSTEDKRGKMKWVDEVPEGVYLDGILE